MMLIPFGNIGSVEEVVSGTFFSRAAETEKST